MSVVSGLVEWGKESKLTNVNVGRTKEGLSSIPALVSAPDITIEIAIAAQINLIRIIEDLFIKYHLDLLNYERILVSRPINLLNSYPARTSSTTQSVYAYPLTLSIHYDAIVATSEYTAAALLYWLCAQEAGENGLLGGLG